MSRAFVKEDDGGGGIDPLPDRPISPHPNIVTPHGLADIDAHLAELQHRHAAAIKAEDRAALAAIARDLRYWSARRASVQVVNALDAPSEAAFGTTVTSSATTAAARPGASSARMKPTPPRARCPTCRRWRGR